MSHNVPRLYDDLAWLWPLWGDPAGEYAVWCDHVTRLVRQYARRPARSMLNMGCGGGKNAFKLKTQFDLTGIDISRPMLDLATDLNPECTFLEADMRTCSLGKRFDAVLIDDAVSYMTNRADLEAAFRTAWKHLQPGGVLIVSPDVTKETFRKNRTRVSEAEGPTRPANVEGVFVENDYDPDPSDDTYEATMVYLIREDGRLRVETDRHVLGLFTLATWRECLRAVGFQVHEEPFADGTDDLPTFACVKPT